MLYNEMLTLLGIFCIKNYVAVLIYSNIYQFFNLRLNFNLYLNLLKGQDSVLAKEWLDSTKDMKR